MCYHHTRLTLTVKRTHWIVLVIATPIIVKVGEIASS